MPGAFWSDGRFIRDKDRRTLILRGWNLADKHKYKPYFGSYTSEDYKRIKAWGFNVIRFVMTWNAIEETKGAYSQAYFAELKKRLDWASQAGLWVVLDMHQDVYGVGFGHNGAPLWTCPEEHYQRFKPPSVWWQGYLSTEVQACFTRLWKDAALQKDFVALWKEVARQTHTHPAVVGYDLFNEPFWGQVPLESFHPDYLQPFYNKVIAGIREVTRAKLIFVEPIALTILGQPAPFGKFDDFHLVYAPHYYLPAVHDGNGYNGDPTKIHEVLDRLFAEAKALGLPMWLGEYGGPHTATKFAAYMQDVDARLEEHMLGGAIWTYGYGHSFAPLDKDKKERKAFLDAVRRPAPMAIAGVPTSYHFDPAKKEFRLTFTEDDASAHPTTLFIPASVFGNAPVVESTDPKGAWRHTYDAASGVLEVFSDATQTQHTITVKASP